MFCAVSEAFEPVYQDQGWLSGRVATLVQEAL